MKKTSKLSLLLVIIGLFLLVACNAKNSTTDQSKEKEEGKEEGNLLVENVRLKAENLAAIPQASLERKDTVIVTLQEPGGVFTPFFNTSGYDGNVQSVMFPPLIDVNEQGEPVPGLAESWEISDDEKTYTYILRDNLKFDDGTPLTTEDVAFTLTLLHDPSYTGGTDITEAKITGGEEYKNGDASSVSGIKIVDEKTLEVTIESPNARALRLIGGQVLKKDYYGSKYTKGNLDYIRDLHQKPVGAGPFRFVSYKPGEEIRYEANEYYYGGKPEVSTFIYKTTEGDAQQFFQTGEVDYTTFTANPDNFELLKTLEFANIDVYTSTAYSYLTFNVSNPILADADVRKALIYGLDRKSIIDTNYQGFAQQANVPVGPESWAYTDEVGVVPFDPDTANELLENAGWKLGEDGIREKDGQKLVIHYFASSSPFQEILIPIAKENYAEIGVDFQADLMDFNALLARVEKGEHDLASFSTTMLTDPYNGVQDFHSKSETSLNKGYKNDKVDQLIDESIATNDIEARKTTYQQLYKELAEDPPVILLSYNKILAGTNARIEGFKPNGIRGIAPSLPDLKIVDVQ